MIRRSSARCGPTPPVAPWDRGAGKPSQVTGTITLVADGHRDPLVFELDLKIKVPLIGGKLEKPLAEQITAGIEAGARRPRLAARVPMSERLTHTTDRTTRRSSRRRRHAGRPAFRDQVCEAQGGTARDVTIETDGDGRRRSSTRPSRPTGLPSLREEFVGDRSTSCSASSGPRRTYADLQVTIPGKPGEMEGTMTLTRPAAPTTETVEIEIKVGIPLVGGKLEGLVADMLRKALHAENKVGRGYLSR